MIIIELNAESGHFSTDQIRSVSVVLEQDKVIVYPTDTLYGLGVNAVSEIAVARLYALKERENAPVSVLLESVDHLMEIAIDLSERAKDLIKNFLPGALTIICRTEYHFAKPLFSEKKTIGFRVPGDTISREIPRLLGHPITTTSVNPAGRQPAGSRAQVEAYYPSGVDLMIDVGRIPSSKGSTVIDVSCEPFKLLREGEISRQALKDFLN